jgi:hypothetical protein
VSIRNKQHLLTGFTAGYEEGWDAAIDKFTEIMDADILHGAPGDMEYRIVWRKNLQSLRKCNPGAITTPEDKIKWWREDGTYIPQAQAPEEPKGPPPPQPEPYVSEPGGPEWEARRRAEVAAEDARQAAKRETVLDPVILLDGDDDEPERGGLVNPKSRGADWAAQSDSAWQPPGRNATTE